MRLLALHEKEHYDKTTQWFILMDSMRRSPMGLINPPFATLEPAKTQPFSKVETIHRSSSLPTLANSGEEERGENELCNSNRKMEAHRPLPNPNHLTDLLHRIPNLPQATHQPQQNPSQKVSESPSTLPRRWNLQDPPGRLHPSLPDSRDQSACAFDFFFDRHCCINLIGRGYALRYGEYHSMQRCVGCRIRLLLRSQHHSVPSGDDRS